MDAEISIANAPFRDPRYAPRRLEVEQRPGGEIILSNPTPFSREFQTTTAALAHWAQVAPDRIWLAERSGPSVGEGGWRTVTFAEAWQRIAALAGGLRELGVVGERPLLILARNHIEHALIAYAAMGQGMPVAPVSPQYGLPGANLTRLAHACAALNPAAVFTEDAALFADGLGAEALAGLPVIAAANPRPGDVPLERLYAASPAQPTATPDQHAKYLLTSGSTGLPKAVIWAAFTLMPRWVLITALGRPVEPEVSRYLACWSGVAVDCAGRPRRGVPTGRRRGAGWPRR